MLRDPFKKLYLHIGAEKTGTTSLQHFFGLNREKLLAAGYLVPQTFVPAEWRFNNLLNHFNICACAIENLDLLHDLRPLIPDASGGTVGARQLYFISLLAGEVDKIDRRPDSMILSSEHIHSRVFNVEDIVRLREFCSKIASEIRIVFYLRPQYQMAISLLGMAIRSGQTRIRGMPLFDGRDGYDPVLGVRKEYFDLNRTVTLFGLVFGEKNIVVRNLYASPLPGNVVLDFCHYLSINTKEMDVQSKKNVNPSFSALAAISALNVALQNGEFSVEHSPRLRAAIDIASSGPGIAMSRDERITFMQGYAEGNEEIRRKYFPDLKVLFLDDAVSTGNAISDLEIIKQANKVLFRVLSNIYEMKGHFNDNVFPEIQQNRKGFVAIVVEKSLK